MGISTILTGILLVLQPPRNEGSEGEGPGVLRGLLSWLTHPKPSDSFSNLPIFGVKPDVKLRVAHGFKDGNGFHRRYQTEVEVSLQNPAFSLEGCDIVAEWNMSRDLIVDKWLLHRSVAENGFLRWSFGGDPVDLEAPSYSPAAHPFTLTAVHAVLPGEEVKRLSIEIPDIIPRYQIPSFKESNSAPITLMPPQMSLACVRREDDIIFRVESIHAGSFEPLSFTIPVATPYPLVDYVTFSVVFLSMLFLLFKLYKV